MSTVILPLLKILHTVRCLKFSKYALQFSLNCGIIKLFPFIEVLSFEKIKLHNTKSGQ